mmetsp:Transcript_37475/g.79847  ORF Transcript_37475/g.79847 Transcript_37475/m.79847 type:complete len:255 (-) Transcript_37475:46-810(-)
MADIYLCGAYGILVALCAMMVLWILGAPATWRAGWSWHDRLVAAWYERSIQTLGHFPTPLNLITKYKGHPVAQLCHTLPGALWAALVPFQLHSTARQRFGRAHRLGGYAFTGIAYLMMVGFAYIDAKGLVYIHADFPHIHPEHDTTRFPVHVPHEPMFRMVAGWFVVTISLAVWHAVHRRFKEHRKWMLRHVASGIWVAVQRLVVAIISSETPAEQKKTFGDGALIGVALTCSAAEIAIWCYARPAGGGGKKAV